MGSHDSAKRSAPALLKSIEEALGADTPDLEQVIEALNALQRGGHDAEFSRALDRLLPELARRSDGPGLLRALAVAALCPADPAGLTERARRLLGEVYKERVHTAALDSAGFDAHLPPGESLRRATLLLTLAEGTRCLDKTWGFGVVKRVDGFYKRVTIDFTRKRGHAMSFAYAGETLQLVEPGHLLARKHEDPEGITALAREQPGEIVRLALASYGPLTVVQLQELIASEILQGQDWKGFWDRARKALKNDPLVEIPTKRAEPIRLLARERRYDEAWFAKLAKERDAKTLMDLIAEVAKAETVAALPPAHQAILVERLRFGIFGTEDRTPELAARLVLLAERIDLSAAGFDIAAAVRDLSEPARLTGIMQLPARELTAWLKLSNTHLPDTAARVGALLADLPLHAVHVVLSDLRALGLEQDVSAFIREKFGVRGLGPATLDYLCAHLALLEEWRLGSTCDLVYLVMPALESPASGERYRAQKSLRERFEDRAWLETVFGGMHPREREQVLARLRTSRGWDETSKRSLLGRLIKLFPDLQEVVARAESKPQEVRETRFTSWRSYRERQEQLRELVEVAIPENSREIGVARSYGDLRENFEYQAAKDQQRLLMRRQAELERDLSEVKGSDFAGMGTATAGMGTGVCIQRPDGREERYWLLGEWDRDETLNIISNRSEVGRRIEGARVGDPLSLPDDPADSPSRLKEILPLDESVKAWIRGDGA